MNLELHAVTFGVCFNKLESWFAALVNNPILREAILLSKVNGYRGNPERLSGHELKVVVEYLLLYRLNIRLFDALPREMLRAYRVKQL